MFGYDFLTVRIADTEYSIPVHFDKDNPERTRLGVIPPEVLLEYEVVILPIPFLLRKDRPRREESTLP